MASRSVRRSSLPLYESGRFKCHLSPNDARTMELRGQIVPHYEHRKDGGTPRAIGYMLVSGYAGESDSPNSPCSITFSEALANVGLSKYRGIHGGRVTRNRQTDVQAKVAEFAVPSWIDRVTSNAGSAV